MIINVSIFIICYFSSKLRTHWAGWVTVLSLSGWAESSTQVSWKSWIIWGVYWVCIPLLLIKRPNHHIVCKYEPPTSVCKQLIYWCCSFKQMTLIDERSPVSTHQELRVSRWVSRFKWKINGIIDKLFWGCHVSIDDSNRPMPFAVSANCHLESVARFSWISQVHSICQFNRFDRFSSEPAMWFNRFNTHYETFSDRCSKCQNHLKTLVDPSPMCQAQPMSWYVNMVPLRLGFYGGKMESIYKQTSRTTIKIINTVQNITWHKGQQNWPHVEAHAAHFQKVTLKD